VLHSARHLPLVLISRLLPSSLTLTAQQQQPNKQQQHEFQETTYKFTYRRVQQPKRYLPETFHQTRNGQKYIFIFCFRIEK